MNTSLSTLIAEGIHPLKIANRTPVTGDEILTLGIPEFKNLHATHCTQMPAVDIATYPWVSTNLLKNKCSGLTDGANGGPIVNKASNELTNILVASTHNGRFNDRCLEKSPCELVGNSSIWSPDTHYTRSVTFLNQCFINGLFTTIDPECELYKLTSVVLGEVQLPSPRILEISPVGKDSPPDIYDIALTVEAPYFRYKYTHDAKSCRDGTDYSQAWPSTHSPIRWELDKNIGMHMLCILSVDSPSARSTPAILKY